MGLFSKKSCDICGGEIGLLGNKKLADGNMCKNCASKLSPWFQDRKHTSLADIKDQLAYREENEKEVANFNPSLSLGNGSTVVMIDEDQNKFIVTSARKWRDTNPDVIKFDDVLGCEMKIDLSSYEDTEQGPDGETHKTGIVENTYTFNEIIRVRNDFFDEIRFTLGKVEEETGSRNSFMPGLKLKIGPGEINFGGGGSQGSNEHSAEYYNLANIGAEIKRIIMESRAQVKSAQAEAAKPKVAVTCKCCGATTIPDEIGRCEFCGGKAE